MQAAADSTVDLPGGLPLGAVRLYLLRHGEAEGARQGRLFGRTDAPLVLRGKKQMEGAARRLRPWLRDWPAAAIYTSPLSRARESAEVLREALLAHLARGGQAGRAVLKGALPLRVVPAFQEISLGGWEGETYEGLMARDPERMRRHYARFDRSRPPGGESVLDLRERVMPALAQLLGRHARRRREGGEGAILVGHAAVNRVILAEALGLPLRSFFALAQEAGAVNVVDFYNIREAGGTLRRGSAVVRLVNG